MRTVLALILALVPSLAFGQGAIRQNGPSTKYDPLGFIQDHQAEAASKMFNDNGRGFNPIHIYDAGGNGVCLEDALTTGAFHQLCLGHDSSGNALISSVGNNGATTQGCSLNVNGTTFPCVPLNTTPRPATATLPTPGNFYVSTTGSDVNDCQSATLGAGHGPCATVQHAVDIALTYMPEVSTDLTVNVAAGGFTGAQVYGAGQATRGHATTYNQGLAILIKGVDTAGSTNINNMGATCGLIIASDGAIVRVQNILLSAAADCSGGGGAALFEQNNSVIKVESGVIFGAMPNTASHMHCETGLIEIQTGYSITGGAAAHLQPDQSCSIPYENNPTITITGAPSFPSGFVFATRNGVAYLVGTVTFSGAVNAATRPFIINSGGVISDPSRALQNAAVFTAKGFIDFQHGRGTYDPPFLPTCAGTGIGASGTCVVVAGSSPNAWTVVLTPATGAAAAGNVTVSWGLLFGNSRAICTYAFQQGGASWVSGLNNSQIYDLGDEADSGSTHFQWSNANTALSVGAGTYAINGICSGR